jgi:hypothetical protein
MGHRACRWPSRNVSPAPFRFKKSGKLVQRIQAQSQQEDRL